jgi:hypothetical protein
VGRLPTNPAVAGNSQKARDPTVLDLDTQTKQIVAIEAPPASHRKRKIGQNTMP